MSKIQELTDKLTELLAKREAARARAEQDERRPDAEAMRTEIVQAKLAGVRGGALFDRRDELVADIMAPVNVIGAEISKVRKELRVAVDAEHAKSFEKLNDDELLKRLHAASETRRKAKADQRAIRSVMNSRGSSSQLAALAAQMTPAARKALAADLAK
jgi:hypothetical protein